MVGVEGAGELSSHMTSGAVVVYLIDMMKASPRFSWIDDDAKKVAIAVSAVGAVAISTGITWSYTATTGDLSIHGATATAVALFAWECIKQFVFQQAFHDLLKGRKDGKGE